MQVLTDDGARIDAFVDGRQHHNVVVLIHGFPLARGIWDAQSAVLARTHCVIRPDLRGCGKSSAPQGPYLMETLAADVVLLLDALGIERAAIVGHSMGGYVALAFARMFTERVDRLALVSSRLRDDAPQTAQTRRELAARAELESSIEPVLEAYLPRFFAPATGARDPEIVERVYDIARENGPVGAAALLRGMALRAPSDDIAEDLDVPVLAIAGAADAVLSLDEARADAQRFARGELVVCESSGHLAMMEEPERVTEALAGWL